MTNLAWLQNWYIKQTDGDWEHTYGITITTLDNPGWKLEIDLVNTELETMSLPYQLVENSEKDWYAIKIEKSKFIAHSDPGKLEFLIGKFKEIVEKKNDCNLSNNLL